MSQTVTLKPVSGWGFEENIDGKLGPSFMVSLSEVGADFGHGIRGWRGTVVSPEHKYAGMVVEMTPHLVNRADIVVLSVKRDEEIVFSGMADAVGLKRDWK